MKTNKQDVKSDLSVISHHVYDVQETGIVQQYAKYADNFIKYKFTTTRIADFKIQNEFHEAAVIAINNNLSLDVNEIFFNLSNVIMKKVKDDRDLYYIIFDLNSVSFTGPQLNRDAYKHKDLILKNCEVLNNLYQDLARFILKPYGLKVKKELTDILQDFVSALDRVDVQIESLRTAGNGKLWWAFVEREYNDVIKCLYKYRYNGINEAVTDLNLRTLRETARDTIHMLQKLLNFLYKMVPIFNKKVQIVVKKTINCTNDIILNFERNLRKEHLDVRELIRDSFRDIFDILKNIKELLFEDDLIYELKNKQEDLNLREFAHHVVTSHIVIFRRCLRKVGF